MTRKDYEMLAEVLNEGVEDKLLRACLFIALGKRLKAQANFDLKKWHRARDR